MRILVVEDLPFVRALAVEFLRDEAFVVVEAGTAEEAIAYAEAEGFPDLLFTDVRMPGALDGMALARHWRMVAPNLPVVLTSGHATPDEIGDLGLFLPKPYRPNDLLRAIASAFAGRAHGSA